MLTGLIWWLLVGLIAGFLAGKVMKGRGFGIAMDIVVGSLAGYSGDSYLGWWESWQSD